MIAASVGFQCPDDVRAGQATVRRPRTAFGGALVTSTGRTTLTLLVVNVLVFLAVQARPDLELRLDNLALASDGTQLLGVAAGQWWRLLTATFLHVQLIHIGLNMVALVSVGPHLEAVLGRWRFLALYLLAALGGSTLSFLLAQPNVQSLGASGAIFGLFGAFYVVARRVGAETGPVVGLIVLNLVITFALPLIDWRAHVGGLITGAAVAASYAYAPSGPRRAAYQIGGCVVVLAVLVAAVLLRTASLRA